ncbi:hypothetical protein CMI47_09710 [Candidatus Pacearchaeota archaeon]|jgi:hypothetical protein|nr:hypothetical protein [Candidatus Pacearchaeota archaeon]
MGLVDLTSDLAIGAGNPLGSPTGNNLGQPTSLGGYSHPGPVNYFPNLNATGFTLNFSGPPTLFTMNGVPEVVNTNPIGRHTAGIEPILFINSDASLFNSELDNLNPFNLSDILSITRPDNNPFNLSDITSLERPEMVEWFNVTTDNSPNMSRSPRQPFNFPSLETPEAFNSYNSSGTINTELSTKGQYDKLPYRDNNVIGFDQPFIIKEIGNKAGLDAVSGVPGLGMVSTMIGRTVDDVKRIGKFILTPQGLTFGVKQFLFYKLNPFEHTRQWNPLGLVSIVPMVHAESHGSMSNSLTAALEPIGPLIDKLKGVAGKAGEAGASAAGAALEFLGGAAKSTINFTGDAVNFGKETFSAGSKTIAPILERFRTYFPHHEQRAKLEVPTDILQTESDGFKIDWTKIKTSTKNIWSKGKNITSTVGKGALSVGKSVYAGVGWVGGHLNEMDWARDLHSGPYTRYQDSLALVMSGKAQGPGLIWKNADDEDLKSGAIGNDDTQLLFWSNLWGTDIETDDWGEESSTGTNIGKYHPMSKWPDNREDSNGMSVLIARGMMWRHHPSSDTGKANPVERWPALLVNQARYFSITDSKMNAVPEWSRPSDVIKPIVDEGDVQRLLIPQPPSVITDKDPIRNYAMSAYGDLPGETNARDDVIYEKTLKTPAESKVFKTENLDSDEKNRELRNRGKEIMYSVGQPGTPGILPVWDDKIKGLIKKGHTGKYANELTDKVNMTPYGTNSDLDFIPFKFKDLVNEKYIVFRATLEGISDTISPSWNESQYIGRPDKVYTYGGADRAIGFSFKVFPNTKQEMIPLWDKVNYLMGLGYPTWKAGGKTGGRLMTPPFVELTIGNLYKDTPGLIDNIGVTVEDSGGWDIDVPLQLPKFLTIQIGFKFIGNYALSMTGKHFSLPWMDGTKPYENFLTDPSNNENNPPVDASGIDIMDILALPEASSGGTA